MVGAARRALPSRGFDRAGLRRKDTDFVARLRADPATRMIPVWRDRHLILVKAEPEPVFLAPEEVPPLVSAEDAVAH